jgi:hypothetical protein
MWFPPISSVHYYHRWCKSIVPSPPPNRQACSCAVPRSCRRGRLEVERRRAADTSRSDGRSPQEPVCPAGLRAYTNTLVARQPRRLGNCVQNCSALLPRRGPAAHSAVARRSGLSVSSPTCAHAHRHDAFAKRTADGVLHLTSG